jgi:hypothetical protein
MKISTIFSLAAIFALASAGSVFAAAGSTTTFTDSGTVTVGAPTMGVKPSKNVYVTYKASTNTPPSGVGSLAYAIGTYHASGSKTFSSTSGDTKIFMQDGTNMTFPASPEAAGASADFSGWTAM